MGKITDLDFDVAAATSSQGAGVSFAASRTSLSGSWERSPLFFQQPTVLVVRGPESSSSDVGFKNPVDDEEALGGGRSGAAAQKMQ